MSWSFYGFWSQVTDAFRQLFAEVERRFIRVQSALLYPIRWAEMVLHRSFGVPIDYTRLVLAAIAALFCGLTIAAVLLVVKMRGRK